jgi:RHS repeat-associated protein
MGPLGFILMAAWRRGRGARRPVGVSRSAAASAADDSKTHHAVYDAWNRLVGVYEDDGDGVAELGTDDVLVLTNEYDGQKRRVQKVVGADVIDQYFNQAWQLLETRVNSAANPQDQYVRDFRYIDTPAVRFYDAASDGTTDTPIYYITDANMNVTALTNAAGAIIERYLYDPYGQTTFLNADGTIATVQESTTENTTLYAGYQYDQETGLYLARNRYHHTTLGTWLTRDPLGFIDGMNVYAYVGGRPMDSVDPLGLWENVTRWAVSGKKVAFLNEHQEIVGKAKGMTIHTPATVVPGDGYTGHALISDQKDTVCKLYNAWKERYAGVKAEKWTWSEYEAWFKSANSVKDSNLIFIGQIFQYDPLMPSLQQAMALEMLAAANFMMIAPLAVVGAFARAAATVQESISQFMADAIPNRDLMEAVSGYDLVHDTKIENGERVKLGVRWLVTEFIGMGIGKAAGKGGRAISREVAENIGTGLAKNRASSRMPLTGRRGISQRYIENNVSKAVRAMEKKATVRMIIFEDPKVTIQSLPVYREASTGLYRVKEADVYKRDRELER